MLSVFRFLCVSICWDRLFHGNPGFPRNPVNAGNAEKDGNWPSIVLPGTDTTTSFYGGLPTRTYYDSSSSDTSCIPTLCEENEYSLNHICTACPPGTTHEAGDDASGPGTPCTPILCEIDHYVNELNQCIECPSGTSRPAGDDASGSNTTCDAILCEENEYVEGNICTQCDPGKQILLVMMQADLIQLVQLHYVKQINM